MTNSLPSQAEKTKQMAKNFNCSQDGLLSYIYPIFSLFLLTLNLKASFSKSAYAYAFAALVTNLDIEVKLRTCMKE